MKAIIEKLAKMDYRLTAVTLIDSFYCSQPTTYISALIMCLNMMLQLELPHVNVFSKIDLLSQCGPLAFDLEFYTDVLDLTFMQRELDRDGFTSRYRKLNAAICDLVSDFSLVSFATLDIQDKASVCALLKVVDKSNGYVFGLLDPVAENLFNVAAGPTSWEYDRVAAVRENSDFLTSEEMREELQKSARESVAEAAAAAGSPKPSATT
eukprot:TRINITY_DN1346_c0_g1_i2.p1 TRINITY_DN1346_c0_g1~~TRINITY_DN1346_c0_g1_i2.p1  ORF type:complete len:209 (-),score=67.38 TRINITY_DN1346_c0_g1_i2:49-675(-)